MPREIAPGPHHVRPFLTADGAVRRAVFIGLAGLDFNKDQRVAVPADKVEFAGSGAGAVIPGDHDDAGALQVAMGDIFPAAAERVVRRHVTLAAAMPQAVCELVKESYHHCLSDRQPLLYRFEL